MTSFGEMHEESDDDVMMWEDYESLCEDTVTYGYEDQGSFSSSESPEVYDREEENLRWERYMSSLEGRWEIFCAHYGYFDDGVDEVLSAFAPKTTEQMDFMENFREDFSGIGESLMDNTASLVLMSSALKDSYAGAVFPEPDEATTELESFSVHGEVSSWSPADHLRWKTKWCQDHGFSPELFVAIHKDR